MAPLRYAAKLDPFLSLDCASTPSNPAQSKERKGSNFAIWQDSIPLFKSWKGGKSREGKRDVEFVLHSSNSSWAGKRSAPPSMGEEEDEQPMMMESHRYKRSSGEAEDADEVI